MLLYTSGFHFFTNIILGIIPGKNYLIFEGIWAGQKRNDLAKNRSYSSAQKLTLLPITAFLYEQLCDGCSSMTAINLRKILGPTS
jgi:hypothetical protein